MSEVKEFFPKEVEMIYASMPISTMRGVRVPAYRGIKWEWCPLKIGRSTWKVVFSTPEKFKSFLEFILDSKVPSEDSYLYPQDLKYSQGGDPRHARLAQASEGYHYESVTTGKHSFYFARYVQSPQSTVVETVEVNLKYRSAPISGAKYMVPKVGAFGCTWEERVLKYPEARLHILADQVDEFKAFLEYAFMQSHAAFPFEIVVGSTQYVRRKYGYVKVTTQHIVWDGERLSHGAFLKQYPVTTEEAFPKSEDKPELEKKLDAIIACLDEIQVLLRSKI